MFLPTPETPLKKSVAIWVEYFNHLADYKIDNILNPHELDEPFTALCIDDFIEATPRENIDVTLADSGRCIDFSLTFTHADATVTLYMEGYVEVVKDGVTAGEFCSAHTESIVSRAVADMFATA